MGALTSEFTPDRQNSLLFEFQGTHTPQLSHHQSIQSHPRSPAVSASEPRIHSRRPWEPQRFRSMLERQDGRG